MKPLKFTEPFHIKLSKSQKAQALALANKREMSTAELFRALLDRELAAESSARRAKATKRPKSSNTD